MDSGSQHGRGLLRRESDDHAQPEYFSLVAGEGFQRSGDPVPQRRSRLPGVESGSPIPVPARRWGDQRSVSKVGTEPTPRHEPMAITELPGRDSPTSCAGVRGHLSRVAPSAAAEVEIAFPVADTGTFSDDGWPVVDQPDGREGTSSRSSIRSSLNRSPTSAVTRLRRRPLRNEILPGHRNFPARSAVLKASDDRANDLVDRKRARDDAGRSLGKEC